MALVRIDKLSFKYALGKTEALSNVSFEIEEGEYVLLTGASGCGKTTLIRGLKPELAPVGEKSGSVAYSGIPIEKLDQKRAAAEIGFVQQNPDNQIVTDYVWHELAFGLECLGENVGTIRRRVAETAAFFGMEDYFRSKTYALSGGQKQLVNLAGVLAMNPRLLILDEPTAMLDPLAARTLLDAVNRINKELGVAVLITEHRLEQVLPAADKTIVMDGGRIISCGKTEDTIKSICQRKEKDRLFFGMSAPVRIFASLGAEKLPLTVRDARIELNNMLCGKKAEPLKVEAKKAGEEALIAKDIWFRYAEGKDDVLRGAEISLREGELMCLMGGNGAGKSTLLNVLCSLIRPYRGKIKLKGGKKLCMLPQNARTLFNTDTVLSELEDAAGGDHSRAMEMAERLELTNLLNSHPYDLSGGETQRLAMGKLLMKNADVLLLDEPTKGLDAYAKQKLAKMLKSLCAEGKAILTVTHDTDFAAQYADECAMMFDGGIISRSEPHEFFGGNRFYTTDANRIAGDIAPGCVTAEEVAAACKKLLA
jgi:energy-coupling factor transport system ATP-binding protein